MWQKRKKTAQDAAREVRAGSGEIQDGGQRTVSLKETAARSCRTANQNNVRVSSENLSPDHKSDNNCTSETQTGEIVGVEIYICSYTWTLGISVPTNTDK